MPPLREGVDAREGLLDAGDAEANLSGVARELLAQGDGGRVLEVRAADLDDVLERSRLVLEGFQEVPQGRDQEAVDLARDRDVDGRREAVVGRLAPVHVIVGVDRLLAAAHAAEALDGEVRQDLVHVHVRLGARAGLPDDEREFVIVLALDDVLRRAGNRLGQGAVEFAEVLVDEGRGLFHEGKTMGQGDGHPLAADLEVLERPLRLGAPEAVGGNLDRSEGV